MTDTFVTDYTQITTVIFDMDGTLIKHTWQLDQLTDSLFARFAARLPAVTCDEFFEIFWPKAEDMWFMMVAGVLNGETAAKYSYVNTLRALGQDTALAGEMVAAWHELVLVEAVPFADTFTVLDALRPKYTTGLITNGYSALQRAKIEHYHLADHVDFTLISEEAGYHKPDQRIFAEALKLAGNPLPAQTLYVGDNPATDIQGALGAGLIPVLIDPGDEVVAPVGVVKIRELSELLKLLT